MSNLWDCSYLMQSRGENMKAKSRRPLGFQYTLDIKLMSSYANVEGTSLPTLWNYDVHIEALPI